MICHLCTEDKLSKEFPFDPLTEDCDHPLLHCLRCVTNSVKRYHKCSQCDVAVSEENEKYKECMETLDYLFPNVYAKLNHEEDGNSRFVPGAAVSHVVVTTLSGECTTLLYNPDLAIQGIKSAIEKQLQIPSNKQCLLYQNTELKTRNENGKLLTFKDYKVPPNSTLYLIILLYEVPEGLDTVIFDLFWGYPRERKRDYLDASVFLYSGRKCIEVVDYENNRSRFSGAVTHSGDVMDDRKRIGHHTIHVSIKSIPADIDKLIFTLSAYNSPNISKYPNPSVRCFDANFPDKELCGDEMSHAAHCQAIVMCCLSKKEGAWQVLSLKSRAAGCAKNYSPLKIKISSLIRKGFI